jgi:hypothetical protein
MTPTTRWVILTDLTGYVTAIDPTGRHFGPRVMAVVQVDYSESTDIYTPRVVWQRERTVS